jgi:predicted  nucleic acid-binding Zn-ribbon protein
MSDHGSMEKKVQELQEVESKLNKEIDELKQERDRRIVDNQRALEKERETFKSKMQEIEQKCKDLENKRSTQIFEFEKERAKWGLEKDFLSS